MVVSAAQAAKRALVTLLLTFAKLYAVNLNITRDADKKSVEAAFRKVVKRTHPDKGGKLEDQQRLQAARAKWQNLLQEKKPKQRSQVKNRKKERLLPIQASGNGSSAKAFLIRSTAVLLTYHNIPESAWNAFLQFLAQHFVLWQVLHWCASMERCESGAPHVHVMLQFVGASDSRHVGQFEFGCSRPNASTTDLCGEGLCRKQLQRSIDRGFFYVYADKIGTLFTEGDYLPCWTESAKKYQVLGKWPETLWKQRKISSDVYERLLFLTRDGVLSRSRNLQACRDMENRLVSEQALEERAKRIRSNPEIYRPFPCVPAADAWLELFKKDSLRHPILIVQGPSRSGKTEWAKSLFRSALELKIGSLEFFPDGMRRFSRQAHDGIVLDDVRDLQFVVDHQDKLQGKYDSLIEFGSTAGGTCAYHLDLFCVPVAVTINESTKNLEFLDSHDWLGNSGNRVIVNFTHSFAPH